jgi:hypothetical protein
MFGVGVVDRVFGEEESPTVVDKEGCGVGRPMTELMKQTAQP